MHKGDTTQYQFSITIVIVIDGMIIGITASTMMCNIIFIFIVTNYQTSPACPLLPRPSSSHVHSLS